MIRRVLPLLLFATICHGGEGAPTSGAPAGETIAQLNVKIGIITLLRQDKKLIYTQTPFGERIINEFGKKLKKENFFNGSYEILENICKIQGLYLFDIARLNGQAVSEETYNLTVKDLYETAAVVWSSILKNTATTAEAQALDFASMVEMLMYAHYLFDVYLGATPEAEKGLAELSKLYRATMLLSAEMLVDTMRFPVRSLSISLTKVAMQEYIENDLGHKQIEACTMQAWREFETEAHDTTQKQAIKSLDKQIKEARKQLFKVQLWILVKRKKRMAARQQQKCIHTLGRMARENGIPWNSDLYNNLLAVFVEKHSLAITLIQLRSTIAIKLFASGIISCNNVDEAFVAASNQLYDCFQTHYVPPKNH